MFGISDIKHNNPKLRTHWLPIVQVHSHEVKPQEDAVRVCKRDSNGAGGRGDRAEGEGAKIGMGVLRSQVMRVGQGRWNVVSELLTLVQRCVVAPSCGADIVVDRGRECTHLMLHLIYAKASHAQMHISSTC